MIDMDRMVLPAVFISRGELCGQNDLISVSSLCHPFAEPHLALLTLISIGGLTSITFQRANYVNEISSLLIKVVEKLERFFFIDGAHHLCPRSTNVHCPKAERRDPHGGIRRQQPVPGERRDWSWGRSESHKSIASGNRVYWVSNSLAP